MTKTLTILVTGGAGYIGSHMLLALQAAGHHAVTLDNLSTGHADAVLHGDFYQGDVGDAALLDTIFTTHKVDAVMHFAASSQVEESMREPEKYRQNNILNSRILLDAMVKHQVQYVILSSTAAIFGAPEYLPIDEAHPKKPVNVYGESKLAVECMLDEYEKKHGVRFGCLRYFNAAGADPEGKLHERHEPETHLIPIVLQAAAGKRPHVLIFGDDYDTTDGSCVRDYIHVNDLCNAHLQLLHYLQQGGRERHFNLGTGNGYSVKDIIRAAEDITKKPIKNIIAPRRAGDPASLIADGSLAKRLLGWQPVTSDIEHIIRDAWQPYKDQ